MTATATHHAVDGLKALFQNTVRAASPQGKMASFLPKSPPRGKVVVVGAGKAAAAMAAELERIWPYPDIPPTGVVVTRYDHSLPTQHIRVLEASHPLPDAAGSDAATALLAAVHGLTADDLVIYLVSGGASALTTLPADSLTLADKRAINRQLLASGAPIDAINTVRKHVSRIKGGRLAAAAAPATVLTLAISDVVGDDISTIGSGAAVPDTSTLADVWRVVTQYTIQLPKNAQRYLQQAAAETPKILTNQSHHIIATANQAFATTAEQARKLGWHVLYLGDRISGEAREVAQVLAGLALHISATNTPIAKPALLLSGGETTVTVRNPHGRGGRNSEFLLALVLALNGAKGIYALAADTDGIDGSEDNAGAWLTPDTLSRAAQLNLDAHALLTNNMAYDFFSTVQQLLITGPTRTNINDFRAILIL